MLRDNFAGCGTSFKNGRVIMIISVRVQNAAEWKKAFDAGAPVREKAGIKVLSVCSSFQDENQITVIEEAVNAQAADDFMNILKSRQKAGDTTKLDVKIYDKVE